MPPAELSSDPLLDQDSRVSGTIRPIVGESSLVSIAVEIAGKETQRVSASLSSLCSSVVATTHPENFDVLAGQSNQLKRQLSTFRTSEPLNLAQRGDLVPKNTNVSLSHERGGLFRTPTALSDAELEFENFSANMSSSLIHHSPQPIPYNLTQVGRTQSSKPQEDILVILSSPVATSTIWAPDSKTIPKRSDLAAIPDIKNPHVAEFLVSEDIVEFLSRGDGRYTEEVWGELLPLVRGAQEEVARSKGKAKAGIQESSPIEQLEMARRHLRSKL